ncbi:membrane-bound lytic murein transglycosylase MltF [Thioalkalivibrio paradoxus]|nr:membrane-bound lytic murein transglycosylase MltF [Thioalkalivibrio paradoxus]
MLCSLMLWRPTLRPRSPLIRRIEIGVFAVLLTVIGVWAWQHKPSALNLALFKQELRVALVSHPHDHTSIDLSSRADQFEHVLLRGLAQHIGARLQIRPVAGPHEAYRLLHARRVDIAAGFLVAPNGDTGIEVGPEILPIEKNLVYWNGLGQNIGSTAGMPDGARIGVTSTLALPDDLLGTNEYPRPELIQYADGSELVPALQSGFLNYAVLTSIELSRLQRVHPELRSAFEFPARFSVVWLFPTGYDRSLIDAAHAYLDELRSEREFELLFDRFFGHLDVHGLVDVITFSRFVEDRLGQLKPLFRQVAQEYGLDWRFLAAVSYQESLWNPDAVSPTGVRGLMMLTRATAGSLGVTDRTDPEQSVDGGARYVLQMLDRLPASVQEPDRTWMALAAYNVGLGHLLDARRLTERGGGDPDLWLDVMTWLPKLAQREWHEQTRHGYARGWEPVTYVQNIRSYYDWLVHLFPTPDDRPEMSPIYLRVPLAL